MPTTTPSSATISPISVARCSSSTGIGSRCPPHNLASAGLVYLPAKGFNANAIVNYVGSRFLDKRNTAPAESYTTWSAGVGYHFGHAEVRVDG